MKNMTRPQVNATMIQMSSIFAIRSFHQIRSLGGVIAMTLSLFGYGYLGDLDDAPDDVENGGYQDAEQQEQKRVVEQFLHCRNRFLVASPGLTFVLYFFSHQVVPQFVG